MNKQELKTKILEKRLNPRNDLTNEYVEDIIKLNTKYQKIMFNPKKMESFNNNDLEKHIKKYDTNPFQVRREIDIAEKVRLLNIDHIVGFNGLYSDGDTNMGNAEVIELGKYRK